MTIESRLSVNTGLGTEITTNVVDYRQVSRKGELPSQGNGMMLLEKGETSFSEKFARASGEDVVEIVVFKGKKSKGKVEKTLIGQEINEISLVSYDGLEVWNWRFTREGDYPPIASYRSRRSVSNLLAALHRTYDDNNTIMQPDKFEQRRAAMRAQRPTKSRR